MARWDPIVKWRSTDRTSTKEPNATTSQKKNAEKTQ